MLWSSSEYAKRASKGDPLDYRASLARRIEVILPKIVRWCIGTLHLFYSRGARLGMRWGFPDTVQNDRRRRVSARRQQLGDRPPTHQVMTLDEGAEVELRGNVGGRGLGPYRGAQRSRGPREWPPDRPAEWRLTVRCVAIARSSTSVALDVGRRRSSEPIVGGLRSGPIRVAATR